MRRKVLSSSSGSGDGRRRRWSLSFTNASSCERRQSSTQHASFLNWSSLPLTSCCQLSKRLRAVSSSLSIVPLGSVYQVFIDPWKERRLDTNRVFLYKEKPIRAD